MSNFDDTKYTENQIMNKKAQKTKKDNEKYLIINEYLETLDSTSDYELAKKMASDESFSRNKKVFIYQKIGAASVSVNFEELQ